MTPLAVYSRKALHDAWVVCTYHLPLLSHILISACSNMSLVRNFDLFFYLIGFKIGTGFESHSILCIMICSFVKLAYTCNRFTTSSCSMRGAFYALNYVLQILLLVGIELSHIKVMDDGISSHFYLPFRNTFYFLQSALFVNDLPHNCSHFKIYNRTQWLRMHQYWRVLLLNYQDFQVTSSILGQWFSANQNFSLSRSSIYNLYKWCFPLAWDLKDLPTGSICHTPTLKICCDVVIKYML